MDSQSPYEDLGLPPGATWKEVRQAYYRLAMRYHPDRLGPGGTADPAKFQQCAQAYRLLREEELRRRLERRGTESEPFDFAQDMPFDVAQDWPADAGPVDCAQDRPVDAGPAVEEAPVEAPFASSGPRRRARLRGGIVAAACAALALAGGIVYALSGRDTWERDHRDSLAALGSEARRLAAEGHAVEAIDRYDEISKLLGDRELLDPDLRLITSEARLVSSDGPVLRDLARREQEAVELEWGRGYAQASRELDKVCVQSHRFAGDPVAESIARRAAEEGARDDDLAREAESAALRERQAAAREAQRRTEADSRREAEARDAYSAAMAGLSGPRVADAVHLLYVAADLGEPRAMYTLGAFYERGDEADWAPAEAAKWYAKAAAAGDRDAMNALGHLYLDGRGVGQDDRKAVEWLKMAAGAGNASAMYTLGTLAETGRSGTANMEQAAAWYRQAAASGDVQARDRLAALAARQSPQSRSGE